MEPEDPPWRPFAPPPLPPPPPPPPQAWPYGPSGYPPAHRDPGRNGFAIAGLVLGIIPVTGGLLGIIFGLIGRSQAKRRGEKGRIMGTIGALLGAAWLVVIITIAVIDYRNDAQRDEAGQVTTPGEQSVFSLQVGDCLNDPPTDDSGVEDVALVPCARRHDAEVFADVDLTYATYPGQSVVIKDAEALCKKRFKPFVGLAYDDSELDIFYLFPTARSWRLQDDRSVTCLVGGRNLIGSVRGARR